MANDIPRQSFPKVGQNDFLEMLPVTSQQAWEELAREQPELAREIEQQAVQLRHRLEEGTTNPIEVQKKMIDTAVFAVETLIHALRRSHREEVTSEDAAPPQSL